VPGSGRRRQARTPLRQRLRLDLLAWGALAAGCATLVLGLTGGGWAKAVVLGLLVMAGCALLTVLASTSSRPPDDGDDGPDRGSAP
jgi:hypothetical protein